MRRDYAGHRGPRYVLRPDAAGRVARFPRAPGHADPAEGAQRPEPLGEPRLGGARGSRRPDAAPRAKPRGSLTAAVEASPAPSRAQRRAGALHGGRPIPQPRGGRWRARCPPRSAGLLHRPSRPPGPTATLPQDGRSTPIPRLRERGRDGPRCPQRHPDEEADGVSSCAGATCAAGALGALPTVSAS